MSWNLEKVQKEIHIFAQHAREVLGEEIYWVADKLEICPVVISTRMTRTKGQFEFECKRKNGEVVGINPLRIKIAKHLLDNYHDKDIIETIKHECVHLIVDVYKRKNMGHNKTFKQFCQMLGVNDETYFTAEPKTEPKAKTPSRTSEYRYIGKCQKCGNEYHRKRMSQSTLENWIHYCYCSECKGELHVIDTKENVEYMKGSYANIKMVSLSGNKKIKPKQTKPKIRTKKQLIGSLYKMKASEMMGSCGYTDNFDSIWFEMLTIYDEGGWEGLTQRQMDSLHKWLLEGQTYCEDSYNKGIYVRKVYV